MKQVVIDSSVWIEFLTKGSKSKGLEKYFKSPYKIVLPVVVSYEVYKWIKREMGETEAMLIAAQMERLSVKIVHIDQELALQAADYGLAYKFPMADALVYASAMTVGATVVTLDRHFEDRPMVELIS